MSKYEIEMMNQLNLAHLTIGCETEYRFDADRSWRFDFAWPALRVACEIDGGNRLAVISKRTGRAVAVGRHTLSDDYTKINTATMQGWRVFRFTPDMIRSGEAFGVMQDALQPLPFAG